MSTDVYSIFALQIFMNNLFQRAYNSIFTRNYFHVNEQHNLHLKFCLEWWLCVIKTHYLHFLFCTIHNFGTSGCYGWKIHFTVVESYCFRFRIEKFSSIKLILKVFGWLVAYNLFQYLCYSVDPIHIIPCAFARYITVWRREGSSVRYI